MTKPAALSSTVSERRAGVSVARVNTFGMTNAMKELYKESHMTREKVQKALEKGAEIMAEQVKASAEMHGLRDSGHMIKSIAPGPVVMHSDSASVDIWPQGTRETRRGRKTNAVVGFVQHYGRSYGKNKRKGTFFFDEASRDAEAEVYDVIEEIWNDAR